jgi:hypothetical protein
MRAAGDFATGIVAAAHGMHEQALPYLENASNSYEKCGAPFHMAHAKVYWLIADRQ